MFSRFYRHRNKIQSLVATEDSIRVENERLDAASAAFDVGYESTVSSTASKRFFGQPPMRNIKGDGSAALHWLATDEVQNHTLPWMSSLE